MLPRHPLKSVHIHGLVEDIALLPSHRLNTGCLIHHHLFTLKQINQMSLLQDQQLLPIGTLHFCNLFTD